MSAIYMLCWLQGIVYVDKGVVGWRPIAKAWLEKRSQQEVHVSDVMSCVLSFANLHLLTH